MKRSELPFSDLIACRRLRVRLSAAVLLVIAPVIASQQPLGTLPAATELPRAEFAFEFRVTLAPPVVVGDTAFGHRQYIPITGGRIAGPRMNGVVLPGGWDYQLGLPGGCSHLSADYFVRAEKGPVIHVLNQGLLCGSAGTEGARAFFTPRFEAPQGQYDWLTRGTFVATLELEADPKEPAGTDRPLEAVRLKFFQLK